VKHYVQERERTEAAPDVLTKLVYAVKNQLYRAEQLPYFHGQLQDVRKALTWPAHWFNERALFVSAERYQEIMLGLINEIKGHGDTGTIKYWPHYLLTCIQRHFRFNADRYNIEGKAARDGVARALKALKVPVDGAVPADAFTREMAAAHGLVKSPGGRRKAPPAAAAAAAKKPAQGEFF
jgi:hypothetical protein